MAKKITRQHNLQLRAILFSLALFGFSYFVYWFSMSLFTKKINVDKSVSLSVPAIWKSVENKSSYDLGNKFNSGFYLFEAVGKKANISIGSYNFNSKEYIRSQDLSNLTPKKVVVSGKEGLLFEPTSSSFGDWKIYLFDLGNKTISIEEYYMNEKTNFFERGLLRKIEGNVINSIKFVN